MKIKRLIINLILFAIIFLGFFLRFYKITDIPHGFFADEAANGFNAYKLLMTGADEYGVPHPFFFRSFGDYRNPVAIYSMIPFIAIFGLNEFAVRLTMVAYGSATIFIVFLFVRELFWNTPRYFKETTSLASAFFLSVSPWHIHFSRTGFEFVPMLFFLTLALVLLLHSIRLKKPLVLLLSFFFFGITFYTYYPIQIVLTPFIIGIMFIYKKPLFENNMRYFTILALLILLICLAPFLEGIISGHALTRFHSVSPLNQGKTFTEIVHPLTKTYIDHFSLDFLFLKSDIDMPGHFISRHSVRGMGELYLFQLPLLILSIIYLLLKDKKNPPFLLLWLALYPIGSTVVTEGPFAHRSLFGVIPFQILSAIGLITIFYFSFKLTKNSNLQIVALGILFGFFVIIGSLSIKDYINKYFNEYPLYSSDFWGWQYGPREIMKYFLSLKDNYDDLYMSGEYNAGHIFLSFYDPKNTCKSKCKMGDFWREPTIYNPYKKQLFSLSPEYLKNSSFAHNFLVKKTIYYPNGTIAFQIGEVAR